MSSGEAFSTTLGEQAFVHFGVGVDNFLVNSSSGLSSFPDPFDDDGVSGGGEAAVSTRLFRLLGTQPIFIVNHRSNVTTVEEKMLSSLMCLNSLFGNTP
jgi:hypothetical protein